MVDVPFLIGQIKLAQDRPEDAIGHLTEAARAYRRAGSYAQEAEADLLLWHAYRMLGVTAGDTERLANLHLTRAEQAFRRAGDRSGVARALTRQIVSYADAGEEAEATFALSKLDAVAPESSAWWRSFANATLRMPTEPDAAAADLELCAKTASSLGENADHWAAECRRKVAILRGQSADTLGRRGARDNLARAMMAGTADEAESHLLAAVAATESNRLQIRSVSKQREISRSSEPIYEAAAYLADRGDRFTEAIDLIELNTSRSAMSELSMRGLWQASGGSFDILAGANQALNEAMATTLPGADHNLNRRVRTALRRRREASHVVEEELVRTVAQPHRVFKPVPEARLRPYLADDDGVVVFTPFGTVYGIDKVKAERLFTFDPDEVEILAERARRHLSSAGSMLDTEASEALNGLMRACIDPVRPFLDGKNRVLIVPTRGLWRVPLAGLGEDPLCSDRSVSYVPSLSVAAMLYGTDWRSRRVQRFVGAANPDGTLPHAEDELAVAADAFYDHAIQTAKHVEISSLFARFLDADVIALACHSGFFDDYPELSWLQLGSSDNPSLLLATDVIRIGLRARVVILSACHAGTSTELPGNEYAGFPGAFLNAGARSVLAPLWAVSDESTAAVMKVFYRELPHATVAEAIWKAQTTVRSQSSTAHPFHWAAFQLFGLP